MNQSFTLKFSEIRMSDVARVGGKNASLGELFAALKPKGVGVLDGFAVTTDAYWRLLEEQGLREKLEQIFSRLDPENLEQLATAGHAARSIILETPLPDGLRLAVLSAYKELVQRLGREPELAVRSSASAEDLPEASFAGAAETFLNVRGEEALLRAVHQCFASLFTDRAISYRARQGYGQLKVALSAGVMPMVRSDLASSGVIFTLDTESGFRDVVTITGTYGLGEFIVQGVVTPDEWLVFKPTLRQGSEPIIGRRLGTKEVRLVYAKGTRSTQSEATPADERTCFCLNDAEVLHLARWACLIEDHYSQLARQPRPMDIEWAKDGITGELFILQARPETVHSAKSTKSSAEVYQLQAKPPAPLISGQAVGERIGAGRVRVITDVSRLQEVQPGEVLVAENTDPDWEPVMRRVAAIVTDQGGRTAHAAIVSREFGIPCIVGAGNATRVLKGGKDVTVCCSEGSEGHVYDGRLAFEIRQIEAGAVPKTHTKVMLIVGDPSQAFHLSTIPNEGVGLARIEFIVTNHIGVHPMALAQFPDLKDLKAINEIRNRIGHEDPREYFIGRLSEGVARIAAAFYPKPVIVRTSDFKTNEYAGLLGGAEFEPKEENPMIGFRGASRYYDPRYSPGFALECAALARVRGKMGLTNLKVMIPFCRTVDEGRKVVEIMARNGLRQGQNGLEIYAMCEIPANVVAADEFLKVFDGYSIGSNDLTQLTLGLDRDSGTVAHLFDENNLAVRRMIAEAIRAAHLAKRPIGICGQAPSDFPEFAEWLVEQNIDSISLNPDTAIKTALRVASAERRSRALDRTAVL
ncbi:MAG: phosphoenolpyruvate synthase, partial [Candidatus Angelobacter sp.]